MRTCGSNSVSASATAIAGSTCPAVPPPARTTDIVLTRNADLPMTGLVPVNAAVGHGPAVAPRIDPGARFSPAGRSLDHLHDALRVGSHLRQDGHFGANPRSWPSGRPGGASSHFRRRGSWPPISRAIWTAPS